MREWDIYAPKIWLKAAPGDRLFWGYFGLPGWQTGLWVQEKPSAKDRGTDSWRSGEN